MNNLSATSNIRYLEYDQPTQKEGSPEEELIDKMLPSEVFEVVMSYLDNKSLQQASSVNRSWNRLAIDTVKQEFSKIKSFTKFLHDNNLFLSQNSVIDNSKEISNASNLKQIKSLILEYKEKILNLLEVLDEKTLKSLEELSKDHPKPGFFENIFQLAGIYKKIDDARQIPNKDERWATLRNISKDLAQNGDVKKAIEVANMIPWDTRELALRDISKALTQNGDIERAIEVANMMPEDTTIRGLTLMNISKALTQQGNSKRAIEIANMIPDKIKGFIKRG
ncbi:MAG: hypothetical protein Tsb0015_12060 [Simkaniaceae bacterium]